MSGGGGGGVLKKRNWKRTKRPPGRTSNDGKVPLSGRPDRAISSGRAKPAEAATFRLQLLFVLDVWQPFKLPAIQPPTEDGQL
jgi:hypothetical protein